MARKQRTAKQRTTERAEAERELVRALAEDLMNEHGIDALQEMTLDRWSAEDLVALSQRLGFRGKRGIDRTTDILRMALEMVGAGTTIVQPEAAEMTVVEPQAAPVTVVSVTKAGPPRPETGPRSSWSEAELAELKALVIDEGPYRAAQTFEERHPERTNKAAWYQYRTRLRDEIMAEGGPRVQTIRVRVDRDASDADILAAVRAAMAS